MLVRSCLVVAARDIERKTFSEELSSQEHGKMKGMGSSCLVLCTAAAAAAAAPSSNGSSSSAFTCAADSAWVGHPRHPHAFSSHSHSSIIIWVCWSACGGLNHETLQTLSLHPAATYPASCQSNFLSQQVTCSSLYSLFSDLVGQRMLGPVVPPNCLSGPALH